MTTVMKWKQTFMNTCNKDNTKKYKIISEDFR